MSVEVLDSREGTRVLPDRDSEKMSGADVCAVVVFLVVMVIAAVVIAVPMVLDAARLF